jgi:hypothetical protein
MGWRPDPTKPIKLNSTFFTLCPILRFVVTSTAKAEVGALSSTAKRQQNFNSH